MLYPGQANSPTTTLTSNIDSVARTISLVNASILPPAPNIATIGSGEDAETILYTSINNNNISVTRAFQGVSKAWPRGTTIGRMFTSYDYDQLRLLAHEHSPKDGSITRTDYIDAVTIGGIEYSVVREDTRIISIISDDMTYNFVRDNGKIVSWSVSE